MPRISELNRTELREFLDRMLIYTKSLTRHLHDAEDLLQNSLVKALSKEDKVLMEPISKHGSEQ